MKKKIARFVIISKKNEFVCGLFDRYFLLKNKIKYLRSKLFSQIKKMNVII